MAGLKAEEVGEEEVEEEEVVVEVVVVEVVVVGEEEEAADELAAQRHSVSGTPTIGSGPVDQPGTAVRSDANQEAGKSSGWSIR